MWLLLNWWWVDVMFARFIVKFADRFVCDFVLVAVIG